MCSCDSSTENASIELFYEQPSNDQSLIEWSDGSLGEETEDKNEAVALTSVSITISTPFYSGLLAQGSGLTSMINHAAQGLWGTLLPDESFQYFSTQANSVIDTSTAKFDYEIKLNQEVGITTPSPYGVNSYYAYQEDKLAITINTNSSNELVGISFENLHVIINQRNKIKDLENPILKGGFKGDAATPLLFVSNLTFNEMFDFDAIKKKCKCIDLASKTFELNYLEIMLFLILGTELTKKFRVDEDVTALTPHRRVSQGNRPLSCSQNRT